MISFGGRGAIFFSTSAAVQHATALAPIRAKLGAGCLIQKSAHKSAQDARFINLHSPARYRRVGGWGGRVPCPQRVPPPASMTRKFKFTNYYTACVYT